MSADEVQAEVIMPMRALFLTPRQLDDAEERVALRQYTEALERFDRETLRRAWFVVRNKHQGRSWPPVAVLIKACVDFRRESPNAQKPDNLRACWEHGPRCERCRKKYRRDGFFTASAVDHQQDEATRAELDSWFRGLVNGKPYVARQSP